MYVDRYLTEQALTRLQETIVGHGSLPNRENAIILKEIYKPRFIVMHVQNAEDKSTHIHDSFSINTTTSHSVDELVTDGVGEDPEIPNAYLNITGTINIYNTSLNL